MLYLNSYKYFLELRVVRAPDVRVQGSWCKGCIYFLEFNVDKAPDVADYQYNCENFKNTFSTNSIYTCASSPLETNIRFVTLRSDYVQDA